MNNDNDYDDNGMDEDNGYISPDQQYPSLMDKFNQGTIELETKKIEAETLLQESKAGFLAAQVGEFDPKRIGGLSDLVKIPAQKPALPTGLILAGVAAYFYFKGRKR